VFLLLPIVDRVLDPSSLADLHWAAADPIVGGTPAQRRAALILLVLAKTLGRRHADAVFADPLLRTLLAVPPQRDRAQTAAMCNALPAAQWRELTARIARARLRDRPEPLRRVTLCRRGRPARFYVEAQRGVCVYGEPGVPPAAPVWLSAYLNEPVRPAAGAARALLHDLRYLRSGAASPLGATADLPLSLIAQGVMREFSARLTGFNASTCEVLRRDFLDFPAAVDDAETLYRVSLGRPPLNIVLNMTSMQRERYRIAGADKDIALFPGE